VVALSRAAQRDVRLLSAYYRAKNYTEALKYLRAALAAAKARIAASPTAGAECPRPYPAIKIPDVLWIFEHRYWIAYRPINLTITGIFYDESDIPYNANDV